MSNDTFWKHYADGCNELRGVQTVADLMRICNSHWDKSSGDAFFPGGSGDEDLLSILLDAGWVPVWIQANYYFAVRDPQGAGLTYVEGDLMLGVERPQ